MSDAKTKNTGRTATTQMVAVRMPLDLLAAVDALARARGVDRTALLLAALRKEVGA